MAAATLAKGPLSDHKRKISSANCRTRTRDNFHLNQEDSDDTVIDEADDAVGGEKLQQHKS